MPIWLKGVGRTSRELARLVTEYNSGNDAHYRYRRAHCRHTLQEAHGKLICSGSGIDATIPCQVLEISADGCSLQTSLPFTPGALAPVQVVLPVLGFLLHIGGLTQWVRKDRVIGIRFNHVSRNSLMHLHALIDCLLGRTSVESLRESIGPKRINLAQGDVLALQSPGAPNPRGAAAGLCPFKMEYDPAVHCGEGRFCLPEGSNWPVVLQPLASRTCLLAILLDISLAGCTIRAAKPFLGDVNESLDVHFKIREQAFRLTGVTLAIYDANCIGIQFDPLCEEQREDLAHHLAELSMASRTQLEVA